MKLPKVERGKRAVVLGRTGSGKTSGALWLVSRSPGPWVMLNVKYDEAMTKCGPDCAMDVGAIIKAHAKHRVVVVHPETFDQATLDDFVFELAESRHGCGLCVDEMLYLSKGNGQAGPGVMGWLTRGRARKQSFIGCTQRPANVSNYIYSEADYYMLYNLKLEKDWQRITEFTGRPDLKRERVNHCFAWYDVSEDRKTEFGAVPMQGLFERFKG